jgi:urocanate hydratase
MMANDPELFKSKVKETLRRPYNAINKHTAKGTYLRLWKCFFLLERREQVPTIMVKIMILRYLVTCKDIMGPCV